MFITSIPLIGFTLLITLSQSHIPAFSQYHMAISNIFDAILLFPFSN